MIIQNLLNFFLELIRRDIVVRSDNDVVYSSDCYEIFLLQRIILCTLLIGWIHTSKITHFSWNRSLSEYVVWTLALVDSSRGMGRPTRQTLVNDGSQHGIQIGLTIHFI